MVPLIFISAETSALAPGDDRRAAVGCELAVPRERLDQHERDPADGPETRITTTKPGPLSSSPPPSPPPNQKPICTMNEPIDAKMLAIVRRVGA